MRGLRSREHTRDSVAPEPDTGTEDAPVVRRDRPYIYHNFTNSLCPTCLKVIQAKVILQNNKVYMLKTCPDHGAMRTLLSSDAAYYLSQSQYNKPGTLPRHFQMPVEKGCPLDCGLCTDHEQHTCLALVEVTEACNLRCPTCFADSDVGRFAPLEEVERMLDTIVANEGYADVVQLSGGEPTIHPQILEIVALAKTKRIKALMINTNGGRHDGFDPLDRTTVPDVIHAVEAQTAGLFRATDFAPLPCHADCISMTYAYVKGDKVKPLPRYVDVKAYLDVIGNQINFGVDDVKNVVGPALTRLWSASA